MKLNVTAFALAFGIWWSVGLLILTWWLMATGAQPATGMFLDRIYIGYSLTLAGSLIGFIWAFVCGTICGGILAWLYNVLCTRIGSAAEAHHAPAH